MRHGMVFRRLGRSPKHLQAMLRNLTGSLFEHEAIKTTVARAKELRRYAEKVITLGKRGNESEVRRVLYTEQLVRKLMFDIAPRYSEREGGYTRILKCGPRRGDLAEMAVIELVDRKGELRPKALLEERRAVKEKTLSPKASESKPLEVSDNRPAQ